MAKLPKYFYFRVKSINKGTGILLEDASDADVVEVVRCRDCRYNLGENKCLYPDSIIKIPDDNDYCSYGRRRLNHDRSGQGAAGAPEGDPDAEG